LYKLLVSAVEEVSGQPRARARLDFLENRKILAAGFKYYVMGLFALMLRDGAVCF
jgi:hypothetical protein